MTDRKRWYAVYTKPRWEKKVHQLLTDKGIESYCPLNKVRRQWSDRVKIVEEPLFKSYVFVNISEQNKTEVRMVGGVVNFVYSEGKPAIIRDREIELIKRFLDEHEQVEACPIHLDVDAEVIINSGVLMDRKATVRKVMRDKVEVLVESIGYKLIAYIDKSRLTPVAKSRQK